MKSDSEDEIFDEKLRPTETATIAIDDSPAKSRGNASPRPSTSQQSAASRQSHKSDSSEVDTEDELERIRTKQKLAKTNASPIDPKPSATATDIYDRTTEEDERQSKRIDRTTADDNRRPPSISPLPEFFENKTFYLCDNLSSIDDIKLRRFVTVYKGEIIETASSADYVITSRLLSGSDHMKGEIVKPLWVFECNDMECLLPTKRYKF